MVWVTAVTEEALIFPETDQVGLYHVSLRDSAGTQAAGGFAVNLFSPAESAIAPADALNIGQVAVETDDEGHVGQREWWPWLLLVALLILLVEWWVHFRGARVPVFTPRRWTL
ncbi:MAG: hypothetical protein M5U34_21635 [Chloroflexi bacterium]|nr:hypothetical protein [Chloroflexota bacterium]